MSTLTQSPAWQALQTHQQEIARRHMRDLFKEDPDRFDKFSLRFDDILLDFSKNRITDETLRLLRDLATQADLAGWTEKMFTGEKINTTEDRAVLHVALRNRSNRPILVDGKDVMPEVNAVLAHMREFTDADPHRRLEGLHRQADHRRRQHRHRRLRPRPGHGHRGAQALRQAAACTSTSSPTSTAPTSPRRSRSSTPRRRCSSSPRKTFTTQETLTNATTAKDWFLKTAGDVKHVAKHFVALSTNEKEVTQVRHRPGEHVRVLGLGRRPLLALVGHRPVDRRLHRHGQLRGAARPAATRWTSTSAPRRWSRTCR